MIKTTMAAALAVMLVACGEGESTTDGGERVCEPGRQVACDCAGGAEGTQRCSDDGSGFGVCQCEGITEDGGTTDRGGTTPDGGDTDTAGDTAADVTPDTQPDQPIGNQGQTEYRVESLAIESPDGLDNTSFSEVLSTIIRLGLTEDGATFGLSRVHLAVRLSSTLRGQPTTVTICQADEADGVLTCQTGRAPATASGTIDDDGVLTTEPNDVRFVLDAGDLGEVDLTLSELVLSGTLDPYTTGKGGAQGQLVDGTVSAKIGARNLCLITLSGVTIGNFCQGNQTLNLLDLIDGPTGFCGQDRSAEYGSLESACTTGTDDMHNPPTTTIGGQPAYFIDGTFSLAGAQIE
jgi:hypothetical protein